MTTKDIIENMEKSFDERFPGDVATMEEDVIHARITSSLYNRDRLKSFIHSYTRTLLESFGEEIMSASIGAIPTSDDYAKGWNDSRQENYKVKSLKVKEIISSLDK